MNRWQFWIFNFVCLALGGLFISNFLISRTNDQLNEELGGKQAVINQARQAEPVLDNLAKRIARGTETDPQLNALLAKHQLNVTLETDGKKKNYPSAK